MGIYSYQDHYRKLSFFASIFLFAECFALGISQKSLFTKCSKKTLGKQIHSAKKLFAECITFALSKEALCRVFYFNTRQIINSKHILKQKLIQIRTKTTTKLYNFSRSTTFILVLSSFNKMIVTLFTKFT